MAGSAQASYSDPSRQMILVGGSVFGEDHRHELTHSALASLIWTANTAAIVNEGTATWLGGSLGKSFPDVMKEYATFLTAHPTITLDSVSTVTDHDLGQRPAGAALVEMTYQHGGIPALKALMASGRTPPRYVRRSKEPWDFMVGNRAGVAIAHQYNPPRLLKKKLWGPPPLFWGGCPAGRWEGSCDSP